MQIYEAFAAVYDRLMDDFQYDKWAEYYLELLKRAGFAGKTLVECACGTGSLTVGFARAGLQVTGVDISEDMLELAGRKLRQNGQQARLIRQDMTKLLLPRPADALVCTCDGVNYLTSLKQAEQFFKAANVALKPGSPMAFDISSRYKLETVLGNGFFGEERDDVAYLWQNAYDPETQVVKMDLTFFMQEKDGHYRRFSEVHRQRAHSVEELTEVLIRCGFEILGVFGDMTFDAPRPDEKRIHFLTRRI